MRIMVQDNTLIAAEQEPISEISIDWGDCDVYEPEIYGRIASRPNEINPHVFTHEYGPGSVPDIGIKVIDNWGKVVFYPADYNCDSNGNITANNCPAEKALTCE
ncbi:MAG: hypothetical protein ABH881_03480 [bacterium]